jgi:hypothetical protein
MLSAPTASQFASQKKVAKRQAKAAKVAAAAPTAHRTPQRIRAMPSSE